MANTAVNWQAVKAELNTMKAQLEPLNVNAEICGNWIWISGNTKRHEQVLRKLGCDYARDKAMWFFVPASLPQSSRQAGQRFSIDEIRRFHGSKRFKRASFQENASKNVYARRSGSGSAGSFLSKLFLLFTAIYR